MSRENSYYKHKYRELLKSEKSKWIPVSERLPEKADEYFITWTCKNSKKSYVGIAEFELCFAEEETETGNWIFEDYIRNYDDPEVVAWMTLPEPYKGGKGQDDNTM